MDRETQAGQAVIELVILASALLMIFFSILRLGETAIRVQSENRFQELKVK